MCGNNFSKQLIISLIIFSICFSEAPTHGLESIQKDFTTDGLTISNIIAWDVIVYKGYLFVAAESSVEIFNLKSNKYNPPHVKSIPRVEEETTITDIYVNQDILCVSMSGYIHLYNVSNPYYAYEFCQIPHNGGNVRDFYIEGNLLFVCNTIMGFKIYDISIPSAPILLSSTLIGDSINEVYVVDNFAFIVSDYSITDTRIFAVLEITNPSFPVLTYESNYNYNYSLHDIYSNGNIIYLFGEDGLFVYDFDGATTELLKHINTILIIDYAIKGSFMYAINLPAHVIEFNISIFNNPIITNSYLGGYSSALDLYEDNIYLAASDDGVLVINTNYIYPPTTTPIPTTLTNTSKTYSINVSLSSTTLTITFSIIAMITLVAYKKRNDLK